MSKPQAFEPQENERDRLVSLIRQSRKGNTESLEELLATVRPRIRCLAQQRLDGKAHLKARFDASDVTQATLIDVVRDLGTFLGTTDVEFLSWLRRILERNVIDIVREHLEAEKRDARKENSLNDSSAGGTPLAQRVSVAAETPSWGLMRNEERSLVQQALSDLPDELSEVIRLKDIDGLSMPEIATRLGYNLRTAYRRYSEGVAALAEILSDNP